MATATVRTVSPHRRKFNMGCDTLHQDEIELGKNLHTACTLLYGVERSRRCAAKTPSMLFRRLRYGRAFMHDTKRPAMILVSENSPHLHCNKASDRDILTPTSRHWAAFRERVRRVSLLPRWADGWCAAAEALDELGFAIAESIATLLCWGIESDEDVIHYRPDRKEPRIVLYDQAND
jgi:hypothetical protein